MGPLVSGVQLDRVLSFVDRAQNRDKISVVAGGKRPAALPGGYFIEPTVLANVDSASEIAQEEVFGPVVAMIPFQDEEHALAIANGTPYGLAAGVWTNDLRRAHRMVRRLKAGTVWVNTYNMIDVTTPWGGMGVSGVGREHGSAAIEAFTEIKTGVFSLR
jgi:aldehyde dehydrogenase (NAD+)